jgi:hypothetical protein
MRIELENSTPPEEIRLTMEERQSQIVNAEAFGQISNGAQTFAFLPYEASGIMGSVGAIRELFQ